MKKRFITMFVFLLIACLMLTGCSVGENTGIVDPTNTPETEVVVTEEPVETEEPANTEDEMYEYEVGGTTLKLRTRIEDYITDEGYFRYMDLATELGWYSIDTDMPTKRMVFDDEVFIKFWPTADIVSYISFGAIERIQPYKERFYHQVQFSFNDLSEVDRYLLDGPDPMIELYYVSFSQIVVTTYILENYADYRDKNFFDGIFESPAALVYKIYE